MKLMVTWDDKLYTGNILIDSQHRELVAHINLLLVALIQLSDKKTICGMVVNLMEKTKAHFSSEEYFLQTEGYSELETHRIEHKIILEYLVQLYAKLKRNFDEHDIIILKTVIMDHMRSDQLWVRAIEKTNGSRLRTGEACRL